MGLTNLLVLAQGNDDAAAAAAAGGAIVFLLMYLAMIVLVIAGMWTTFAKAGKPGWAAIVPIYNIIVLLEIVGKPLWWIVLFLVPCVNFVMPIVVGLEVAKVFGKGQGFGLGLGFLPFIFYPILGFGDAKYHAPPTPV